MSASVQSPISDLPILHTPAFDDEAFKRGTLPEGKTLEKVLAVICNINLTLTLTAGVFLIRLNESIKHLQELTEKKQKKMITEAFVITALGVAAGAATFAGGLAPFIAPAFQRLNNQITPDMVSATSKAAATVLKRGSDGFKTYSDAQQTEIDMRRNIEQSVILQSAQQANTDAERQRDTLNQHASQIVQSQNRSSGG